MIFTILLIGFIIKHQVEGLNFLLVPNTVKCLKEFVNKDILLIGEFNVSNVNDQEVDYIVRDSRQAILARNENINTGRFSVVTEHEELYEICFRSRAVSQLFGHVHHISIVTMKGLEINNKLTEEERIRLFSVETGLKQIEGLVKEILDDFKLLNQNEVKMSNTNESSYRRILYLGVFSTFWLLGTSAGQLYHLYRYFKSKKIIQ